MAKHLLLFFSFFLLQTALAGGGTSYKIAELRQEYLQASRDEEAARRFYAKMSGYKQQEPLVLAYKAASEAVMAKYVWNPYSKLKHLKTGGEMFAEAVALDAKHPEIRFLRFTVEHYVPRYLNMSQHLQEDKQLIIRSLQAYPRSGISAELARAMRDFMLQKDHCTEEEKKVLQQLKI